MIRSKQLRLACVTCLILFALGCARRDVATNSALISTDGVPASGISAEPEYQSDPLYLKIAVGPESNKVFWTATDLEAGRVFVDLNNNGDLTESGEMFELVESQQIQDTRNWSTVIPEIEQGEDVHTDLKLKFGKTGDEVRAVVSMRLWGWDDSTTDADLIPLLPSRDIGQTPTIHFNGPLTMGCYRSTTKMPIGKEFVFYSLVGTTGLNGGTLTAISNTEIPDDAHPKAEFEFPHRDSSKPPIKINTFLTVRC